PGMGVLEIWKNLVPPERFKSISIEDLLRRGDACVAPLVDPEDKGWADYLKLRYGWGRHGRGDACVAPTPGHCPHNIT
ncbi:MAG: hypothetical protein R6U89_01935, partial [Dehalococcoidia bacterium]